MYLVLLGAPGTGKGTQAKVLAEHLGLAHIATGDMFRDAVQAGSKLGREAQAYMDRGALVPDEITIGMLEERIQQPDSARGAVFDGFPRSLKQATALDKMLEKQGKSVTVAVNVVVDEEELVLRLTGRWLCPNCGEIYHERNRPPRQPGICDQCGSALLQREDDKPDVVRERLRLQRPPNDMIEHYRDQAKLREVDGGRSAPDVTSDILHAVGSNSDLGVATY